MYCANCGKEVMNGSPFCEYCGTPVEAESPEFHRTGSYQSTYEPAYEGPSGGRAKNQTMKMVLIGAGIGIAVLLLIFATFSVKQWYDNKTNMVVNAITSLYDNNGNDYIGYAGEVPDEDINDTSDDTWRDDAGYSYWEDGLYDYGAPRIFPYSSEEYLYESDLYGLSDDEIQKAINDIYAWNGYIFETNSFQNYYEYQDWYIPISSDMDEIRSYMNCYEIENIELMKEWID